VSPESYAQAKELLGAGLVRDAASFEPEPPRLCFTRWRCPKCERRFNAPHPLFKIDCKEGHDWAAMEPVTS
jgi:hypothetical protein